MPERSAIHHAVMVPCIQWTIALLICCSVGSSGSVPDDSPSVDSSYGLLGDMEWAEFETEFFDQIALVTVYNTSRAAMPSFKLPDFASLILTSRSATSPTLPKGIYENEKDVRVVKRVVLDDGEHWSAGVQTTDGTISGKKMLNYFYRGGYSLVLNKAHLLHPYFARICRALSNRFLVPCVVNLYATPPGAQGFEYHYDAQSSFVLQLDGAKQWAFLSVKDGSVPAWPREHLRKKVQGGSLDENVVEHVLATGEVLMLPRGIVHEAHTVRLLEPAPSLHATISLEPGAFSWEFVFHSQLRLFRAPWTMAEYSSLMRLHALLIISTSNLLHEPSLCHEVWRKIVLPGERCTWDADPSTVVADTNADADLMTVTEPYLSSWKRRLRTASCSGPWWQLLPSRAACSTLSEDLALTALQQAYDAAQGVWRRMHYVFGDLQHGLLDSLSDRQTYLPADSFTKHVSCGDGSTLLTTLRRKLLNADG